MSQLALVPQVCWLLFGAFLIPSLLYDWRSSGGVQIALNHVALTKTSRVHQHPLAAAFISNRAVHTINVCISSFTASILSDLIHLAPASHGLRSP